MKTIVKIFLLLFIPAFAYAQNNTTDSLKQLLRTEKADTSRVQLLNQLSRFYLNFRPDTAMLFAREGLSLAKKAAFVKGEAESLNRLGNVFSITGNYPKALEFHLDAAKKAETAGEQEMVVKVLGNIGIDYALHGDDRQAIVYIRKGLGMAESLRLQNTVLTSLINLGAEYEKINVLDSALIYINKAYDLALKLQDADNTGIALDNLGNIYAKMGQDAKAMANYRLALPYLIQQGNDDALCEAYLGIAKLFLKTNQADSSLRYAKQSLAISQNANLIDHLIDVSNFLTTYYVSVHKMDSAFIYQGITLAAKDSIFSQEKQREIQNLSYDEMMRQQQAQEAKEEAKTQLKFNLLIGSLVVLMVTAFFLYRNNKQKQKANLKIEKAYAELKSTQAQLIQSEKMASLGELTAGIAHEIQNPLNFVNNFSDINKDLLTELKEEADGGNMGEVKTIANDIMDNSAKIAFHGKRADAIVKGMLQHSRISTGKKEPTDINALCDEYLRLSYHGLRVKDKSFKAEMKTDFEASLQKVNVVPQNMGRVLLNLFNNAFYAVNEKAKLSTSGYQPTVEVATKSLRAYVEITVKDNGTGIPSNIVNKIFQPFFTTKPTGSGTGLGLSLAYDIVTKEHNGTINVESSENEGTTFVIQLPVMAAQ